VVTVCPSSTPASASAKAPVQKLMIRAPRCLADRSTSSIRGSSGLSVSGRFGAITVSAVAASASVPGQVIVNTPSRIRTFRRVPQATKSYHSTPSSGRVVPNSSTATLISNGFEPSATSRATRCRRG
jgi:hypothetical protein